MSREQKLILTISILASFIGGLDGFIVNVALPAISRDLGGGLAVQQWVVDGYLITLGSLILIAGSLSDLFGQKRLVTIGLWWFGAASLLCALAPNGQFLIIARVLQGIGGALLVPSSLAMIMATFKGRDQSKAIGTWTGWTAISALVGPLLGGLIISVASWRWIFAINILPIALALHFIRLVHVPPKTVARPKVDWWGAFLCASGLAAVVTALIEQPKYGWGNGWVLAALLGGAALLAGFIWQERGSPHAMLPLNLFKRRNFAVGNIATTAIYAGLSVSSFALVISLQQLAGYSALQAGLAMLPVTVIMFVLSPRFGALASQYGPRLFMSIGPIIGAVGFLLMLRAGSHVNYLVDLLPGVLVFGLGLSITVAPLTAAILGGVPTERSGIASAVNNAVARIAGLLAIALIGVITGAHLTVAGFHRALIAVAVLLVIGGVVSACGITNRDLIAD